MEQDIGEIKDRQYQMETLLNQTAKGKDMKNLKGRFDGAQYEAKAVRNLEQAGHSTGRRRLKLLSAHNMPNDPALMEKLEDAIDQNRVAEASVTVHTSDVYRAVRRAHLLQQATGTSAIPAVIGDRISNEAQRLADQEGVKAMRISL